MSNNILPTKTNMMKLQNSLKITKQGYELLERKKLVLTKELEKYNKIYNDLQKNLYDMIGEGKELVKSVNIEIGSEKFMKIAEKVEIDDYLDIKNVTLMGVEIPSVVHIQEKVVRSYDFYDTTNKVDETMFHFNKIQELLIDYTILDNTIKKIKIAIEKVRKRANALQNIIIPEMEENYKAIVNELDEREREEFARLKVVKKNIN